MVPAHSYKNLIVYQKAKELTVGVIDYFYSQHLSRLEEVQINQLARAVSSIGANIAEGYGRHYKQDYRRFISIARGSSFEADYWLDILTKTKPQYMIKLQEFRNKNDELSKMLTGMMKKLEQKT